MLAMDDGSGCNEVLGNTPILMEHCADDEVVPLECARAMRDALLALGGKVEWKEYPRGSHWLKSPEGLDDLARFLKEHVFREETAGGAVDSADGSQSSSNQLPEG